MSHIPYTICRSGIYYYNRRVPKHAVNTYGQFIRYPLSSDPEEATTYAKRLSYVLESSWQSQSVSPINISSIITSFIPKPTTLSDLSKEYISLRNIQPKPTSIVVISLIKLAGDRDIKEYCREDDLIASGFIKCKRTAGRKPVIG